MAENITVNTKSELRLPKVITEARMDIAPVHMDVLSVLLAEISKETDIDENLDYTLTTRQYADLKGITDAKEAKKKILRDICGKGDASKSIRHAGFEIAKGEKDFYGTYCWFQDAEYENGVLKLMFGSKAKKLLVELKKNDSGKVFALLKYILPMKSGYAKRVYLMCKQFVGSGKIYPMNWETFKWRLAIPESYRDSVVISQILEKSKEEINKLTDIVIDYKLEHKVGSGRSGKRINKISFTVEKKSRKPLEQQELPLITESELWETPLEPWNFTVEQKAELRAVLVMVPDNKLPPAEACQGSKEIQWYHYIEVKVKEMERRNAEKKIRSRFSYLLKLLKNDAAAEIEAKPKQIQIQNKFNEFTQREYSSEEVTELERRLLNRGWE